MSFSSRSLLTLPKHSLPELEKTVDDELAKCRNDLALLPHQSTKSPKTIIMLSITAFCQDIFDMVWGNKEKNFVQSNRALYSGFKQEIVATTPDFRPCESSSKKKKRKTIYGTVPGTRRLVAGSATEPRTLQDVRQVIKR